MGLVIIDATNEELTNELPKEKRQKVDEWLNLIPNDVLGVIFKRAFDIGYHCALMDYGLKENDMRRGNENNAE